MICNFCGKTLDTCDEVNLGNISVRFCYGSKRDGEMMKYSLCSDCLDKLTDEFISHCKHEPKIIDPFEAYPDWEVKSTEESDY